HRAKVRRPRGSRRVRGRPRVRAADGADVAVAPLLSGDPLDGVVPVAVLTPAVVVEGDEPAFGGKTPADVLDHHRVALRGEERWRTDLALGRVVLAVRRPLEEGRERPAPLGQVDIRAEHRSVAHRLGHVTADGELLARAGHAWLLGGGGRWARAASRAGPAAGGLDNR